MTHLLYRSMVADSILRWKCQYECHLSFVREIISFQSYKIFSPYSIIIKFSQKISFKTIPFNKFLHLNQLLLNCLLYLLCKTKLYIIPNIIYVIQYRHIERKEKGAKLQHNLNISNRCQFCNSLFVFLSNLLSVSIIKYTIF